MVSLVNSKYPQIKNYDEDKWINDALKFTRDASEVPAYDALTGNPQPMRARFVDFSVKTRMTPTGSDSRQLPRNNWQWF